MPINTPKEVTDGYAEASKAKASSPAWRLFVLAVAAGVLIGLGAVTSSTAAPMAWRTRAWCGWCRGSYSPSA